MEPFHPSKRRKLKLNDSSVMGIIKRYGEKYPHFLDALLYLICELPRPLTTTKIIDTILCENQGKDEIELINELRKLDFQVFPVFPLNTFGTTDFTQPIYEHP